MNKHTSRRLSWLLLPLVMIAWMAAPEWPARASMMDSPWRAGWVPLATAWAELHPARRVSADGVTPGRDPFAVTVAPSIQEDEAGPHGGAAAPPAARGRDTPPNQDAGATVDGGRAHIRDPEPPSSDPGADRTDAIAGTSSGAAQNGPTTADNRPSPPPTEGTVLMLGDSLMGEVAAGLRQHLPRTFRVVDRHKSSTGLTNLGYYDWPATAKAAVEETQPTWAVIHMGGNDAQDMLIQGHFVRFGSPAWQEAYLVRARLMIHLIRQADPNVRLAWIGLPAMRSDTFDARMEVIRKIQKQAAEDEQVPYLDGHEALGKVYSKDGEIHGRREILRANDGIHYSLTGGTLLAHEVVGADGFDLPWEASGK